MAKVLRWFGTLAALSLSLFVTVGSAETPLGVEAIASKFAEVDGPKLHYLSAGKGPAVLLLHGYTQTSRMWRPIIPSCGKYTLIAPDLPGIGDSDIPPKVWT
jgi:hypothetical protein